MSFGEQSTLDVESSGLIFMFPFTTTSDVRLEVNKLLVFMSYLSDLSSSKVDLGYFLRGNGLLISGKTKNENETQNNLHQHDHNLAILINYLKNNFSPNFKYAVWRNTTGSLIRHVTNTLTVKWSPVSNLTH
ncbi:hypothetical protein FDP41_002908 [Naegleria fowleri]|uniref:Uncharacterized protein n=1 Tax=Naegleria fowleri TaxID=5763 RepID=A0A6A5BK81_NAEFO|nr:uncharacterized protein FDP41_002908 [Naegleria fowleri]KAF0978393.1 hypothetical protein FDP41_002908 [Naegleria fowleri]